MCKNVTNSINSNKFINGTFRKRNFVLFFKSINI